MTNSQEHKEESKLTFEERLELQQKRALSKNKPNNQQETIISEKNTTETNLDTTNNTKNVSIDNLDLSFLNNEVASNREKEKKNYYIETSVDDVFVLLVKIYEKGGKGKISKSAFVNDYLKKAILSNEKIQHIANQSEEMRSLLNNFEEIKNY